MSLHTRRALQFGAVALSLGAALATAHAHGGAAPIAIWGNFPSTVAGCQKAISHATAACVTRAFRAHRGCTATTFAGEDCDTAAVERAVTAARSDGRAAIRTVCNDREAMTLRYADVTEAQFDLVNVCRSITTALTSGLSLAPPSGGATQSRCFDAAADGVSRALRLGIETVRANLDRIASSSLTVAEKNLVLGRAADRMAQARAALLRVIAADCGPGVFEQLFGRSPQAWADAMLGQIGCYGGGVYVQDAILCPAAQCGDGVQQAGEECDDGNVEAGDGCSAECTRGS